MHAAECLGRDDDFVAVQSEVFDGLAQHDLRLAFGIDIRRVVEVDARVEGLFDQDIRTVLLYLADGLPKAVTSCECHRPETKLGHFQAGTAE